MQLSNGHDLLALMAGAAKADPPANKSLAFGYVTTPAGPYVTFDEDLTETPAALSVLNGYSPSLGDRVMLQKVNGSWVILGPVGASPGAGTQFIPLPLTAGLTYGDLTYYQPAYYKDSSGWVHYRGQVRGSAAGLAANATAWIMPVGYRTTKNMMIPCYDNVTGAVRRLSFNSGTGIVSTATAVTPTSGNFSIDNVEYFADA